MSRCRFTVGHTNIKQQQHLDSIQIFAICDFFPSPLLQTSKRLLDFNLLCAKPFKPATPSQNERSSSSHLPPLGCRNGPQTYRARPVLLVERWSPRQNVKPRSATHAWCIYGGNRGRGFRCGIRCKYSPGYRRPCLGLCPCMKDHMLTKLSSSSGCKVRRACGHSLFQEKRDTGQLQVVR